MLRLKETKQESTRRCSTRRCNFIFIFLLHLLLRRERYIIRSPERFSNVISAKLVAMIGVACRDFFFPGVINALVIAANLIVLGEGLRENPTFSFFPINHEICLFHSCETRTISIHRVCLNVVLESGERICISPPNKCFLIFIQK